MSNEPVKGPGIYEFWQPGVCWVFWRHMKVNCGKFGRIREIAWCLFLAEKLPQLRLRRWDSSFSCAGCFCLLWNFFSGWVGLEWGYFWPHLSTVATTTFSIIFLSILHSIPMNLKFPSLVLKGNPDYLNTLVFLSLTKGPPSTSVFWFLSVTKTILMFSILHPAGFYIFIFDKGQKASKFL